MEYYELAVEDNLKYLERQEASSKNLIISSPPYLVGKDYEKHSGMTPEKYIETQDLVLENCKKILHENGSICWQVGNRIDHKTNEVIPLDCLFYPLFKKHGFICRNRIIWHFGHGLHCKKRFSGRYETILWFTKSDKYTFNLDPVRLPQKYPGKKHSKGPNKGKLSCNPLGANPSDLWSDIPNVKFNHVEKTVHPCQFPIGLVERLILSLTNPKDSVLDPHAGVGGALIAALKHGRSAFGCEIRQDYADIALGRIEMLKNGTLPMRPLNKKIYEEKQ